MKACNRATWQRIEAGLSDRQQENRDLNPATIATVFCQQLYEFERGLQRGMQKGTDLHRR